MNASRWKPWALVLGVVVLLLAGVWLWISSGADRRWEAMKADWRQLEAEGLRGDGVRDVLRGDPLPGSAWPDYFAADKLITGTTGATPLLAELSSHGYQPNWRNSAAMVQQLAPALERIRRGTRRADGGYPRTGFHWEEPLLGEWARLRDLILAQERIDAEAGRARQAAELLLDFIRLSHDYARNGYPVHINHFCQNVARSLERLRQLAAGGRLSDADLAELEQELEILDRTMPLFGPTLRNWIALTGRTIEEDGAFDYVREEGGPHWRYGFSPRLEATALYFSLRERFQPLLGCDGMSWLEESAAWDRYDREDPNYRKPGANVTTWRMMSRSHRADRARLRLLRMVIHRRRTGGWLELDDPFGVKLLHSESPTGLEAWSGHSHVFPSEGLRFELPPK